MNVIYCTLKNVKELALGVLSDHTKLPIGLNGVKHEDNVLMVQSTQDANLFSKILNVLLRLPLLNMALKRVIVTTKIRVVRVW